MTTAAIYCRVSTDAQEREGTSLKTQLEACRAYCKTKGYQVLSEYQENYSGLTLTRPDLTMLREQIRKREISHLVIYCLDRLSRDPNHGAILFDELEKYDVILEGVIEDISNSDLGRLISYIRGYASKLEAEKIKERTQRGKRERAKSGKLPGSSGIKLYGYTYIPGNGPGQGVRVINEEQAHWCARLTAGW